MTRIFFFLTMLCLAFSANAQSETQLKIDAVQAVYMGSYTEEFGTWTLVLADGEENVANIDIFANSAKRLAGTYSFSDGTMTGGIVFPGENEYALSDGHFTISYVGKGTNYPVYHIEGELQGEGNTFLLNSDVELLAYDYLFYLYYEMGAMDFESCVVQLQDAPDEDTGVVVEMDFVGGNWEYIDYMGILKVTAETADGRYTQLLFDADETMTSGTYTINDLYASYCYIANLETTSYEAYFKSGTAEITVSDSPSAGGDKVLSLVATMKAKTNDVYILRIPVVVPVSEDFNDYVGIHTPLLPSASSLLPHKTLRNGRVIIEKAGHRFGTNGVRLQ